ncbi:unnamed protein product [Ambrosiozyma monospora]|uniref:Unnamed protein product n=1 Tax=Ambrosiozyma monospora TaxID=43982 RepID=A0A9W6Z663_AMBMO|nr:unnamed protein product [Ambrosiozyma monospora]
MVALVILSIISGFLRRQFGMSSIDGGALHVSSAQERINNDNMRREINTRLEEQNRNIKIILSKNLSEAHTTEIAKIATSAKSAHIRLNKVSGRYGETI